MLIGFCGLPNTGKSTFLKLLSKIDTEIANYPFTTLKPKEAVVPVFSKELEKLHNITKTREVIPGFLKFLDVPGLIRGAHKGEGLGNEFLSYLRQCDAILEIVRTFENSEVTHPENTIDPERDILIVEEEIIEAEKSIIKKNLEKLKRATTKEEKTAKTILEEINSKIDYFKRFSGQSEDLKNYNLLLTKNWYLIFNGSNANILNNLINECMEGKYNLDFKWELELEENPELQNEFEIQTRNFLEQFRKDLGLIQFFTITNEITQAWLTRQGSSVYYCAGLVHSDFQNKFKNAEIVKWTELLNIVSLNQTLSIDNIWKIAKERGLVKTVGKDYIVKENDIIKIIL